MQSVLSLISSSGACNSFKVLRQVSGLFLAVTLPNFCMSERIFPLALFLSVALGLFKVTQGNDECRTLLFESSIEGGSLSIGHVISFHVTESSEDCELKCYFEDDCMSINVRPLGNGTYYCELNDSDHVLHPRDLEKRTSVIFRSVQNFCAKSPCTPNGRCQTGFGAKGYRCKCSSGFKGEHCSNEIIGQDKLKPGISCKHILDSGSSEGDGEYWIDPNNCSVPIRVYCDMTTAGGGWVLVTNIEIPNSTFTAGLTVRNSYGGIENYKNNVMALTNNAMNELCKILPVTELRFHCRKQMKRTFHVITALNITGQAVVQYFCGQTDELPSSCNSFKVMRDDNSILAGHCNDWGDDGTQSQVGTWGHYLTATDPEDGRLYSFAVFIGNTSFWHLSPIEGLLLCDDNGFELPRLHPGDFWKIYAR